MRNILFFSTLANTFDFKGRATRLEYWVFTGISTLLAVFTLAVDITQDWYDPHDYLGPASTVLAAVLFLPNVSVSIRRLHDADLSGSLYLLIFVPLVGPLFIFMLAATPGSHGPNRFGPDPYGTEDDIETPSTEQSP